MASSTSLRSRKAPTNEKEKVASKVDDEEVKPSTNKSLKNEPLPTFPKQRVWTRMVIILCTLVVVYFTSSQDKVVHLARVKDDLSNRRQEIKCSPQYYADVVNFPGCSPSMCGRIVMDYILSKDEATRLLNFARQVISLATVDTTVAAATVVDLASGSLIREGAKINNIHEALKSSDTFTWDSKILLSKIRRKIQEVVAMSFKVDVDKMNFTRPTLVSRLTSSDPIDELNEYWRPYADKDNYKSFHYTSVLFLNGFDADFKGGRFIFDDPENVTTVVEPKAGRILTYTSGQENVHRIERIVSGEMYIMTVPFTCDPKYAVDETVK